MNVRKHPYSHRAQPLCTPASPQASLLDGTTGGVPACVTMYESITLELQLISKKGVHTHFGKANALPSSFAQWTRSAKRTNAPLSRLWPRLLLPSETLNSDLKRVRQKSLLYFTF